MADSGNSPGIKVPVIQHSRQNENDDFIESLVKDMSLNSKNDEKIIEPTQQEQLKELLKESAKKQQSWAFQVDTNIPLEDFEEHVPHLARKFPFTLDAFQKYAVYYLEKGKNVFVAAHTSAGKTVVAEYAMAMAQRNFTKAIYTSPIKALSNQKFRDFRETFGEDQVGLLTGDVQINVEANCIIMTTEILRSMLYKGADMLRDVEFVIFDEVHYVNDLERGVVWEEVLIMLPADFQIILLSATVPNTLEFADWVGRLKKKEMYVIKTLYRPVPLEHSLFLYNSPNELFKIVDRNKHFNQDEYKRAWDIAMGLTEEMKLKQKIQQQNLNEKRSNMTPAEEQRMKQKQRQQAQTQQKKKNQAAQSQGQNSNSKQQKTKNANVWHKLVMYLQKNTLLPVVFFTFSKRKVEEFADSLRNTDLLNRLEKSQAHVFIDRSFNRLKEEDKNLPQLLRMSEMLKRGIGVHHSGLLPIVKELVEILFAKNLLRVLFATETFAMGVNMPAKTVCFTSLQKWDGQNFRYLLPGEYTQMSGRAGRRGLDDTGNVLIAVWDKQQGSEKIEMPQASTLQQLILGQAEKLTSQFRLTYNMILNLLRMANYSTSNQEEYDENRKWKGLVGRVEEMMKKSFFENVQQKEKDKLERQKEVYQNVLQDITTQKDALECSLCCQEGDKQKWAIQEFYEVQRRIFNSYQQLMDLLFHGNSTTSASLKKIFATGRLCLVRDPEHGLLLGLFQKFTKFFQSEEFGIEKDNEQRKAQVLVLMPTNSVHNPSGIPVMTPMTHLQLENVEFQNHVYSLGQICWLSSHVYNQHISTESFFQQFTKETLSSNTFLIGNEFDLKKWVKSFEFSIQFSAQIDWKKYLFTKECSTCPQFIEHFKLIADWNWLEEKIQHLNYQLSDQSLFLLPEYNQRLDMLQMLNYVDHQSTVQLKGRVACDMNTINSGDSLLMIELLFENVFGQLTSDELVALLSSFVFQEKSQISFELDILPTLTPALQKTIEVCLKHKSRLDQIQLQLGIHLSDDQIILNTNSSEQDLFSVWVQQGEVGGFYGSNLNFGLVHVVYYWAQQVSFEEITQFTDIPEGSIVRAIVRLDELLGEMINVCHEIANTDLEKKLEEARLNIKRDIVFAASLYTDSKSGDTATTNEPIIFDD